MAQFLSGEWLNFLAVRPDKAVPTLKHLLEELKDMSVEPDEIRMPGTLYDDLVNQAEDVVENPDEKE